jgi:hypothetical protein
MHGEGDYTLSTSLGSLIRDATQKKSTSIFLNGTKQRGTKPSPNLPPKKKSNQYVKQRPSLYYSQPRPSLKLPITNGSVQSPRNRPSLTSSMHSTHAARAIIGTAPSRSFGHCSANKPHLTSQALKGLHIRATSAAISHLHQMQVRPAPSTGSPALSPSLRTFVSPLLGPARDLPFLVRRRPTQETGPDLHSRCPGGRISINSISQLKGKYIGD